MHKLDKTFAKLDFSLALFEKLLRFVCLAGVLERKLMDFKGMNFVFLKQTR